MQRLSMDAGFKQRIEEQGVKYEDYVEFAPIYGRKKKIKLKRTAMEFVCERSQQEAECLTTHILGNMKNERLHFRLSFKTDGQLTFACLESLNGTPFRINDSYCMQAFLEQGDRCYLGKNVLSFSAADNELSSPSLGDDFVTSNKSIVKSNLPILIEGETGTGKTTLARKIHDASGRLGNFVHLNISSLSQSLIESELFGHKRGAFTGALIDKKGALQEADGGTLFLDEIDSLSWELQTKLLLFLDDQIVRTVGGGEKKVNARMVYSSGSDLKKKVEMQQMRNDFFFRIGSGELVRLKTLREDPTLIEKFCQQFACKEDILFTTGVIDFYKTLPWPGNIRQLKGHLVMKKIVSPSRKLSLDAVDENLISASSDLTNIAGQEEVLSLKDVRKRYAQKIYFRFNKNLARSARSLQVAEKTLKRILVESD